MRRKRLQRICIVMALCVFAVGGMMIFFRNHSFSDWVTVEATCHEGGYDYRVCKKCDSVEYKNRIEPIDHTYGDSINDIQHLVNYAICEECGFRDESGSYVPPADIPILYFNGTTGSAVVSIDFEFEENGKKITSYGDVSIDSNSDNVFKKKDYDFILYSDKKHTTPFSFAARETFGELSEYLVRAEYLDRTCIRNIAASEIWSQVVASRDNLDKNIAKLKFYGADYGVPALLYTNGNYKGLHTLNYPNNRLLFGLGDNKNHALVYSKSAFGYFDFRYESSPDTLSSMNVIWPDNDVDSKLAEESFLAFSDFVNNSSDSSFRTGISTYLDVDAAIDYLICMYAFGADSNVVQHCNWVTYNGQKWIPSMYNLTYTFGLTIDGLTVSPSDTMIPQYIEEGIDPDTDIYLWNRLINNFESRIRDRYTELRGSVLSEQNVSEVFAKYDAMISDEVHDSELAQYPEKSLLDIYPGIDSVLSWYKEKVLLLDSVLLNQ